MAPFFLLLLFVQILLCKAGDTINSTTPLSGSQKILSQGNKFTVGFHSPSQSNTASSTSSSYYIAIWYSNIPQVTTVWNTDKPVSDPATASLEIARDGNLVLLDQAKNQLLWSTNVSIASNSTMATIRDSGSLELTDASNSSIVYWRSIDHPTNTWLPGGKLGLNKTTGLSQRLLPWKNKENPSPGLFSLELDPNGTKQYFIQWNESINYWTSGPWNGNIFSLVPEMTANFRYDFQFVDNATESYFYYSMKDDTVISRFIMDVTGQIKQLTWVEYSQQWILFWSQPRTQCEVYALCGAYGSCSEAALPYCNCIKGFSQKVQSDWDLEDYRGGCKRNVPLQCQTNSTSGQTKPDKFYTMAGVRLPDNAQRAVGASSKECEQACLKSCSCDAYTYNTSGCFIWSGDLVNLQEQYSGNGVGKLFLRLAASELQDPKRKKATIVGGVVGGVAAILIILAIVFFFVYQKFRRERTLRISKTAGGTLIAFRYSDLQHVTKNFSEKLGGGAFGSVFKGKLPDSTAIAVKRLDGFHQGEKQFRAEVSTIGTTQHVNLVRLLGFCSEGSRRLLVYEYMQKGSLEVQLFPGETTALSWAVRYQIALGTARGLNYLHEKCRDCIIHCDVKPDNILLDDSFVPKVSDFGLAKLLGRDFSRVLTTMRGTRGYLAPEWISGVPITAKADVFSYGMMLLEIISGRRNADHGEEGRSTFFPTLAASKLHEGDVQTLLDPRLKGDANPEELTRACKVACWCIQDDESTRPTTGQIIQILEGFLDVNMPPIPRSLRALGESPDVINFFSDLSSSQTSQTQNSTTTSQTHSATSGSSHFHSS
ncbi:putative serine/threonine-protein kinase receptor [Hordeum vulgare]|uniref:Receptor-like serine/threonine-protein kinase n=1 Tax=Hordeum vulgare subsp. vulgare TaxID=112509 RepID=A0A8I6WQY8_HORVV|nr:G-type lectin S-receptor-like serine/threonine-protein kinase At2g19130 [Hordeum vulgare subsp. vulgare]KAE8782869.1 putative serine/threonine-protein kinase receptor [Hordeum vulgare]